MSAFVSFCMWVIGIIVAFFTGYGVGYTMGVTTCEKKHQDEEEKKKVEEEYNRVQKMKEAVEKAKADGTLSENEKE